MKKLTILQIATTLYSLILFLSGCLAEKHYSIRFQNNASHPVSCIIGITFQYPDTFLPSNKPHMQEILPGKSTEIFGSSIPFKEVFDRFQADTLSVYVFHPDTLNKYDWAIIRSQYKVLKRYDLSYADVENARYVITYP